MKEEMKKNCNCTTECKCGCNEGKECTCNNECKCDEETCSCGCNEGKECTCDNECKCGEVCHCEEHKCSCDEPDCHEKGKKDKKKHKKEIEELKLINQELADKLLREKAELINYRRRKDEEVARMLKYSNEDFVKSILPIIDNLESAIKMDDTNLSDEVSKFLSGFKMIYGNILTVLETYEIKPIDGINKPFDPTYHQAVMTEKCDKESGIVIDVLRKGYIYKDKVLRPAMVKVSE